MTELHERGFNLIGASSVWQTKQRLFYQMRHDGLRRQNKPFPTAADTHFPLIDMHIGELKPFWMAQAFGGDRLTDFVAMAQQTQDMTESCADYFDFLMRYKTKLRYVMEQMVDTMLLRGRGILLATTNPFKGYRIEIQNIDPQFLLIGQQYDDFDDADHWVWVQHLTVDQYKRNRNFEQDGKLIDKIRGHSGSELGIIEQEKETREGVTHTHKADEIILWNHYVRGQGDTLTCNVYSPQNAEQKIRDPFQVPYELDGEPSNPFSSFTMEIKDAGWYSPRGIAELNAPFEAYATKCWNEESDYMTFTGRPVFTSESPLDNAANFRLLPGSFIPGNAKAVQFPQPPISFAEKINFTRGLSEQRSRTPDFGTMAPGGAEGAKPRTATENNRIAGLQAVGADHNGDTFRNIRLLKFYQHLWALVLHGEKCRRDAGQPSKLTYFIGQDLKELPAQAVHDQYLVLPAGGSANKQQRAQAADGLFMLFKGAPNIDQDELSKQCIAARDSRLIKKLLIPSAQRQQSEAFQEDVEIMVLQEGRPVPVLPNQDHATRIMELIGFLHSRAVLGHPPDPTAINAIQQHMAQHFMILKQQQPQAARQLQQQIAQMEAQAQQPANVEQLAQLGVQ